MTTTRQFIQTLPVVGTTFAVAGHLVAGEGAAHAQELAPVDGHFHPKGKAPSPFTREMLKQAKTKLPLADKRDFEEQKKGLIAPMKDLHIKADAGRVAWDMERFQFLKRQADFDSTVSPSRCSPSGTVAVITGRRRTPACGTVSSLRRTNFAPASRRAKSPTPAALTSSEPCPPSCS